MSFLARLFGSLVAHLLFAAGGAVILLLLYGIVWVFGVPLDASYAVCVGLVGALAGSGMCFAGCMQSDDLRPHLGAMITAWLLTIVFLLSATYRILHSIGTL